MSEKRIPLQPDLCYHIYNRTVGDEKFFKTETDYMHFISKMREHIFPVSDLIAYCLQPKHFNLIVRVKSKEEIIDYFNYKDGIKSSSAQISRKRYIENRLSGVYGNLFNSYAKHYNWIYGRTGTLFKRSFMRDLIENKYHLNAAINHVHLNPVKQKNVARPEDWKFSSYKTLFIANTSVLSQNGVMNL
jgi:putative transposase